MRRWHWLGAATVAVALTATPAGADHTPRLSGQLVDQTGSLGRGAQRAVDELLRERDVQLYAVFVRSTGGSTGPGYAAEVARENGLGGNDAVLVVAPGERRYGMWVSRGIPGLTSAEVNRVLSARVEPELRAGDWDGAVAAAADGLGDAVRGDVARTGSAQRGGGLGLLLLLVLLGAGVYLFARRRSRRRAEQAAAAERAERHRQLTGEAAAALISADERLRDAEAEVRLTETAVDEAGRAALREHLVAAREHLRQAFELRAREEDDGPDIALLEQVLAAAGAAAAELDAVTARTAELRDLQANAAQTLAALGPRVDAVAAAAAGAEVTLERLRPQVPESAHTVDGNLAEARKRIEYARSEVVAGGAAVAAKDMPGAARRARAAEQSAARAEQLVEAVAHLEQAVADAAVALPGALREAERVVTAAREVAPAGDDRVARAETAWRQARGERDAVVAVRLAGEAAALAQPAIAAQAEAREQASERRRALEAALASAHAAYTTAADFVAARREGIGDRPRARLRLAERELDAAERLKREEPEAAYDAARRAEELAYEAYELAVEDFERLDRYNTPFGGGFGGFGGFGLPIPIPIIVGGGGGWGGPWGGGWGGGWDGGGGDAFGGDFGGGDSFGGGF
ncbi:MAG TPA: TPM domain-containing protein [Frankiaceae bacterium]|nr:TPM domain-containing protein [Frankiaceae bacterium]